MRTLHLLSTVMRIATSHIQPFGDFLRTLGTSWEQGMLPHHPASKVRMKELPGEVGGAHGVQIGKFGVSVCMLREQGSVTSGYCAFGTLVNFAERNGLVQTPSLTLVRLDGIAESNFAAWFCPLPRRPVRSSGPVRLLEYFRGLLWILQGWSSELPSHASQPMPLETARHSTAKHSTLLRRHRACLRLVAPRMTDNVSRTG